MEKLKIVHLITGLGSGGAEHMLFKLVTNMDSTKFTNIVVSLSDKGFWGDRITGAGIQLHCLGLKNFQNMPLAILKLLKLIDKLKPDILQTWLYHADFFGTLAGYIVDIPITIWNIRCSRLDSANYSFTSGILPRLLSKISKRPNQIIANSQVGLNDHRQAGYEPQNWQLIPNGFDVDIYIPSVENNNELRKKLAISSEDIVIGFVARNDYKKGHEFFFRNISQMQFDFSQIHILIIGRGFKDESLQFMDIIQNSKVNIENIHFLGEQGELYKLYPAFDFLVLPSLYGEGFPNVLGEAMSCAVPCIASDSGESKKIIGETGFVFEAGNNDEFKKVFKSMVEKTKLERNVLGKQARKRILDLYSIDAIVKKYEENYLSFFK